MQLAIDFAQADVRATRGMQRSADHAERVSPGWVELAVEKLAEYARTHPSESFTIEQARAALAGSLDATPELRAWGHVTKAAIKRRIIVFAGADRAASSNGSLKPAYRAGEGCV